MNKASDPNHDPDSEKEAVFDYKFLRTLLGVIAFALPFLTDGVSSERLPSISYSYYTEGHDAFFGMLLVIATLLLAYNGFSLKEKLASKLAAVATVLVAVFPTNCEGCGPNLTSSIHYGSAAIAFLVLIYFCFGPFRERAQMRGQKGQRRAIAYMVCGSIMSICLAVAVIAQFTRPADVVAASRITYWTEAFALGAFGVAWFVAGKVLPPLAAENERLKMPWEEATPLQKAVALE